MSTAILPDSMSILRYKILKFPFSDRISKFSKISEEDNKIPHLVRKKEENWMKDISIV